MQNNRTTDSESPPLDCEDWRIAFQPYENFPELAFILAQHLHSVSRKAQIESAIAAVKAIIAASGGSFDGVNGGVISPDNIPTGAFLRLSIADATKKFLDMVKTKQSVPQITQALERGGLPPAKTNTVDKFSAIRIANHLRLLRSLSSSKQSE